VNRRRIPIPICSGAIAMRVSCFVTVGFVTVVVAVRGASG
jgi:hypothetical protein